MLLLLGLVPCCRMRLRLRLHPIGILPSPSYAFEGAADFVHDDQGGDGGDDGMLIMEMRSMNVVTGQRM